MQPDRAEMRDQTIGSLAAPDREVQPHSRVTEAQQKALELKRVGSASRKISIPAIPCTWNKPRLRWRKFTPAIVPLIAKKNAKSHHADNILRRKAFPFEKAGCQGFSRGLIRGDTENQFVRSRSE